MRSNPGLRPTRTVFSSAVPVPSAGAECCASEASGSPAAVVEVAVGPVVVAVPSDVVEPSPPADAVGRRD